MDQTHKFLKKLDAKRRSSIVHVLEKIYASDFSGLDIKKLRGGQSVFRVRKGNMRIIYIVGKEDTVKVLSIEFRGDTTY